MDKPLLISTPTVNSTGSSGMFLIFTGAGTSDIPSHPFQHLNGFINGGIGGSLVPTFISHISNAAVPAPTQLSVAAPPSPRKVLPPSSMVLRRIAKKDSGVPAPFSAVLPIRSGTELFAGDTTTVGEAWAPRISLDRSWDGEKLDNVPESHHTDEKLAVVLKLNPWQHPQKDYHVKLIWEKIVEQLVRDSVLAENEPAAVRNVQRIIFRFLSIHKKKYHQSNSGLPSPEVDQMTDRERVVEQLFQLREAQPGLNELAKTVKTPKPKRIKPSFNLALEAEGEEPSVDLMDSEEVIESPVFQDFSFWCGTCEKVLDGPCAQHRATIFDRPILPRALASLPPELCFGQKLDMTEKGVFAKTTLKLLAIFGPLVAPFSKHNHSGEFQYALKVSNAVSKQYNLESDTSCNWMKYVRFAETLDEQNVTAYQQGDRVYFATIKSIASGCELKVWYSRKYADSMGKPYLDSPDDGVQESYGLNSSYDNEVQETDVQMEFAGTSGDSMELPEFEGLNPPGRASPPPLVELQQPVSPEFPEPLTLHQPIVDEQSAAEDPVIPAAQSKTKSRSGKNGESQLGSERKMSRQAKRVLERKFEAKPIRSGSPALLMKFKFKCDQCPSEFRVVELFDLHYLKHKDMSEYPPEISTTCPSCSLVLPTRDELLAHIERHGKRPSLYIKQTPFKCTICSKHYSSTEFLERHIRRMHTHPDLERSFQCDVCQVAFVTKAGLTSHKRIHSGKKYFECPVCLVGFQHSSQMKEHSESHCVNGQFHCRLCTKSYGEFNILKRHLRITHSAQPCTCQVCGIFFSNGKNLKRHMICHDESMSYKCDVCGKSFRRKEKIKDHMDRLHNPLRIDRRLRKHHHPEDVPPGTEAEPAPALPPTEYLNYVFKCHDCKMGFRRRDLLVNHMVTQHPDKLVESVLELIKPVDKILDSFPCRYCETICSSVAERKIHIRKTHSQTGPAPVDAHVLDKHVEKQKTVAFHLCTLCNKHYVSHAKLLQHQRYKHPNAQ